MVIIIIIIMIIIINVVISSGSTVKPQHEVTGYKVYSVF